MRREELLKGFGVLGSDRTMADVLADDRSILPFHQGVIGGPIGSGFCELDL